MNAIFDEVYDAWVAKHLSQCSGERKRRLEEKIKKQEEEGGDDYPEKLLLRNVWWPVYNLLRMYTRNTK